MNGPKPSQNELNGELSTQAQKRLGKERMVLDRDAPTMPDNIFFSFDDTKAHRVKALVIGPCETPYAFGYYLFDITFPNCYPLKPPHVKFCSTLGQTRMNPNLYADGKVCLSILGTWSGPGWTAACGIKTVMTSIQTLLSENPIENEPGYENSGQSAEAKKYAKILKYENLRIAVHHMLDKTPHGFEVFAPHMSYFFLKHFADYEKVLQEFKPDQGKKDRSPTWNFPVEFDPAGLLTKMQALKAKIVGNKQTVAKIAELHAWMTEKTQSKDNADRQLTIPPLTEEMLGRLVSPSAESTRSVKRG